VGEGAWPRTFFVAVAPKNFSALLVRPIVLDGYPVLVFKSLIALQKHEGLGHSRGFLLRFSNSQKPHSLDPHSGARTVVRLRAPSVQVPHRPPDFQV